MSRVPGSAKIILFVAAIAALAVLAIVGYRLVSKTDVTPVSGAPPVATASNSPAAAGASGPPQEASGPRVVALIPRNDGREACDAGGLWCISVSPQADDEGVRRPVVRPAGAAPKADASADQVDTEETHAVWPKLVVLPEGGFLAGIETRLSTSYSGGGGSATELRIFRISGVGASPPALLLTLPVQGSLLIRACFSETDLGTRGEACHDEYGFTGRVEIEPDGEGLPQILYTTEAWAFPRGASRDEDSTTRGPLSPADLVREPDATCSFRRRFRFDARAGRYRPDRALPDCTAYTVP